MRKILCVVQARTGSTRLPNKVIREINGIPMVEYTLQRLLKSNYITKLVLATTHLPKDRILKSITDKVGIDICLGFENEENANVLERYYQVAKMNNLAEDDLVVRITGDCPVIEPTIVDTVIKSMLDNPCDYVRTDVPNKCIRGFDTEVFTMKTLSKVREIVVDKCSKFTPHEDTEVLSRYASYKEHVTLFIYRHPQQFSIRTVEIDNIYNRPYRLCVDTIEDFTLISKIYEHFNDIFIDGKSIVEFLDNNPDITKINSDIKQKIV